MTKSQAKDEVQRIRFLVTIKTYPTPSIAHRETVCTGGVTADGRWIRLYPVPFGYWDRKQQYRLYDWVEVNARKRPVEKDKRKESYEPTQDIDLKVIGHIGTEKKWAERKRLILPFARQSIEATLEGYERDGESLGIIKPAEVTDVRVERDDTDWSPKHQQLFAQMCLFGAQPKPLEKPRHRFSYSFRCDDARCRGHTMLINDWGLCWLYLKTLKDEGEGAAVRKTKQKCWDMVADDKDSYFYVGTVYPKPSFIVLGVFYPKKECGGQ